MASLKKSFCILISAMTVSLPVGVIAQNGPGLPESGSLPLLEAVARSHGLSLNLGTRKIIGGVKTTIDKHPWQVALLDSKEKNERLALFCGGSIVASEWIVTAAHCVDRGTEANQVDVLSGASSLGEGGTRVNVQSIHVHPQWNPNTMDHDIALLRIGGLVNATPIALLRPAEEQELVGSRADVTVTGWGVTSSSGSVSPDLREVTVPLVSLSDCRNELVYGDAITETMICAGQLKGGKDSCQGDSGGPLTGEVNGAMRLVGVVSWGRGCAMANSPGVYTRLPVFLDWVRQISKTKM